MGHCSAEVLVFLIKLVVNSAMHGILKIKRKTKQKKQWYNLLTNGEDWSITSNLSYWKTWQVKQIVFFIF
jgi:hypothetical protein